MRPGDVPDERLELTGQSDVYLKKQVNDIDWSRFLNYGQVTIHVKQGRVVLIKVERTIQ